MTTDRAQKTRRTRRTEHRPQVLITGIGGNLGRQVARRLHRTCDIVGVDRRQVRHMPKDIDVEMVDIRRRRAEDIFRRYRFEAVVHLNILHDPRSSQEQHHDFNIIGTQKIAQLCAEHGVQKLVVLSSADVYGASPNNDQLLRENAPLMGSQNFDAIRDLISLDMLCNTFFWRHPEIETIILRPVHIIGRLDNAASTFFRRKRAVTIMGYDPMIQLIHAEDVVEAIERALMPGVRGVYNIAGPPPVPLSYIYKCLDITPTSLPEFAVRRMLKMGWTLKLSDWRGPELEYLKYVCMVDDSLARRELQYKPKHDLQDIIRLLR